MRRRLLVWPLILMFLAGICWAQESEKKQKGGEKTPAAGQSDEPQPAHDFKLTPEDKARKNPQKFTTVSVERGKKIYATQCAVCHGEKGDGKGDLASEMKTKIPDFTDPTVLAKYTDGEIFAMIGNGSFPMPGQGERLKDFRKWQLVNYLRSLSGKVPEKSTGNEPEEGIILVPQ
jgi:mono/diheme cytochrome c family protein